MAMERIFKPGRLKNDKIRDFFIFESKSLNNLAICIADLVRKGLAYIVWFAMEAIDIFEKIK